MDELEERINDKKMCKIPWCSIDLDGEDCAMEIKDQLAATVRGRDMREIDEGVIPKKDDKCFICGKPASYYVYAFCPGPGQCQRTKRSLVCRTFPFEPQVDKKGKVLGLVYINSGTENCILEVAIGWS